MRRLFGCAVSNVLVLLIAACTSTTPAVRTAIPSGGPTELFQQAPFQDCELRSFIALGAARQAILFHETESQLLMDPNIGPFQTTMYHELFARIRGQGLRDYNWFAAEHFLACSRRESVALHQDVEQVAACFAWIDILLNLRAGMWSGQSESEANAVVKNRLSSRTLYPEALIDKLTPMTYSAPGEDAFFKLRQSVFESCLQETGTEEVR